MINMSAQKPMFLDSLLFSSIWVQYFASNHMSSQGAIHLIPKWPLIYADTNWPLLPHSR